ncbi:MAG: zinc ribbon domain-containing protein [Nitrospirota bacterium]|nr:zinc ribbon domain-containing protein [Nitrospirota bacterium]MDP2382895.1 zinc ribbon domain-containing protein [Nitrospirota bacterium]
MPLYEYRCLDCHKRSTALVLSLTNHAPATCSHCLSPRVERMLSRFASPKSEAARLEALAEPDNLAGLDKNDPQSMARFMKKMGDEMGEDLGSELTEAAEQEGAGPLELEGTDSL